MPFWIDSRVCAQPLGSEGGGVHKLPWISDLSLEQAPSWEQFLSVLIPMMALCVDLLYELEA